MCRLLSLILAVSLVACATPRPDTPSGNLEITLTHVRADCAHQAAIDALASYGYRIEAKDGYRIIAGRLRPDDSREERLTLLFLPQRDTGALRVVIYGEQVRNPGTDFELREPRRPTQAQQEQLEAVKPRIESQCAGQRR